MKLLRMSPGRGDVLLAEGDPDVAEDEERLIDEFRRQLDAGMWAAVPVSSPGGRHEATMVRDFAEVPRGAEQVIFFPPAAGGAYGARTTEREAEADRRAEELLASAVGAEAFAMYCDLGFLELRRDGYGYLIYPHRPVIAYDARDDEPLNEYCVLFPDSSEPEPGPRLPDADDVLAKWLALRGDERRLLADANLDAPGRQLDPEQIRRDLRTLRMWQVRRDGAEAAR